jgi:uncharacterized protein (TIGR02118 family)
MVNQSPKFVLVVKGEEPQLEFTDRLINYMSALPGTGVAHVALPTQPDPTEREPSTSPASLIVEWFAAAPPDPARWADALQIDVDQLKWYVVSEALRWNRPGTSRSVTGISHICCVARSAGLTAGQFEKHWTEAHRPLAQKHHFGMELYVQNVVREQLGSTGPGIDGIAELGFRSVESFQGEMYDSDEGLTTIAADVSKFVGAASCGLYRLLPS